MFVVDKHLADCTFDKCKGHVVLHGNEQDPEMYLDRYSPTVAVHSIFACLTVAAHRGIKEVAKIDVKGAFIQTPMEGSPVYMRCSKELTQLIVEVYPHLKKFMSDKGYLFCKLLKALYGCVQASKLWFNKLVKFLQEEGYEQSPIDPCVMRRIVGNDVWLLLIYVDDMVGNKHSYLGMQICLEDGYGKIDMIHYITKMLESVENLEVSSVPANKNILVVDECSALLSEGERKRFHTLVAQLLFLSKRARPEISAANGFLCTRVTKATEEDCLPCNRFNFFKTRNYYFIIHNLE